MTLEQIEDTLITIYDEVGPTSIGGALRMHPLDERELRKWLHPLRFEPVFPKGEEWAMGWRVNLEMGSFEIIRDPKVTPGFFCWESNDSIYRFKVESSAGHYWRQGA